SLYEFCLFFFFQAEDGIRDFHVTGVQTCALPIYSPSPIGEVKAGERRALLLGSEGDGLSSRWLHEADHRVRIPMDEAALARGVDSLNVVAAAAIACYELTR